ncbi:MAG: hypothetical protein WB697_09915 [Stellaceae bacterium]
MISLSEVADWASIAALLVSAINALLIFSVKRRIVLNVTLEPLLFRLKDCSQRMNASLLEYPEAATGLNEIVGLCDAEARAIRRRFGFYRARFCARLLRSITHYRRHNGLDEAQAIYDDLQQVIQELVNRIEELRITGL